MAVIRQVLSDFDVMKIEGEQGRPVYSLGQLNVGQIRHTIGKLDEYWYLGQRMKPYLTFFFQSFRVNRFLYLYLLSIFINVPFIFFSSELGVCLGRK